MKIGMSLAKFHSSLIHEVNDYMLEICSGLLKLQAKVSSARRVRKGIFFKQNCSLISVNARGDIFAQWLEYIILFKRPVERDSIDKLILNQKLCDSTLISPCLTLSTQDKEKYTGLWVLTQHMEFEPPTQAARSKNDSACPRAISSGRAEKKQVSAT